MNPSGEISSLASHAATSFFKKKYPYLSQRSYKELAEAKEQYKKWSVVFILAAIVCFFILPVLYGYLAYHIYIVGFECFIKKGEIFYPATWLSFIILGFFWALSTLVWAAEWVMRVLLRGRFDEFEDYYNHNQGYDNHKAGRYIGKIAFVISLVVFPFTFNQYVITRAKSFDIKTIIDFSPHRYIYTDVSKIVYYSKYQDRQGLITPMRNYDVFLKDGYVFGPLSYFNDVESAVPFIRDLSRKSGIPLDSVDVKPFK